MTTVRLRKASTDRKQLRLPPTPAMKVDALVAIQRRPIYLERKRVLPVPE